MPLMMRETVVVVRMVVVMNPAVPEVILVLILVLIVPVPMKMTVHTSPRESAVGSWSVPMSMSEVHDAGRKVGQAGRTGET